MKTTETETEAFKGQGAVLLALAEWSLLEKAVSIPGIPRKKRKDLPRD